MSAQQTATRTRRYPERKVRMYKRIQELAQQYSVIASSKLYKVRAAQLNEIRKRLRGKAVLYGIKNKLAAKALRELGLANIDEFIKRFDGQTLLIFTNMNPFELQLLLEKSKVDMPARPGDVAPTDIVVPSGNTGIPPGPILSTFKQFKIPTRIESGSIVIAKDTVVAKAGDVISSDLASLLSKLGLKPIKAGLSIEAAYWRGRIIPKEELVLDIKEYEDKLKEAYTSALSLAINTGYPAPEIISSILIKAGIEAERLALSAAYPAKEVLAKLLAKAQSEAEALSRLVAT